MRGRWHAISRHRGLLAALVLALVAVAELAPSLSGARMLSPESLLFGYEPFAALRPADVGPANPLLSDVPTAFQPWARTAHDAFGAGRFPSWDPSALLGVPLGANPQAQLLNPLALPLRIFPLDWAYGLVAALKLWFAGFGAYLLARELRCGVLPALVAGLALMASSYMVVWLQWPHSSSFAFLPWLLWLIERSARGSRGAALALAAPVALMVLGGHPGTYVQGLFLAGIYAVLRLALMADTPAREWLLRAAAMAGGLAIGLCLAAPELVPTLFNRSGSTGLAERAGASDSLDLAALRTLLFPDWWGRPGEIGGGAAVGNFNERTVFSGVAALALAAVALSRRDRWRTWLPLAAIALLGALVSAGVEPFRALVGAVPPMDSLNLERMSFAVNLGVPVLAALGLQSLLDGHGRRAAAVAGAATLAICLVALIDVGPVPGEISATARHFVTGADFRDPEVLALTAIGWAALFGAAVLALGFLAPRLGASALAVLAVLAVAVDGARFMHGYNPQVTATARPGTPPSIAFLKARAPGERVTALGEVLPPDSGSLYGLRDLRGHDPPDPPKRLVRLLHSGWPLVGYQSRLALPPTLDRRGLRVLDTLGVRWVFTARAAPAPKLAGLRVAYAGPDAKLLRSSTASQRAYVPRRVLAVAGERALLARLQTPGFSPGRDALVEGARPAAGRGTVRITRDEPERVQLQAAMRRGGLVVLSDSLRDGWSVRVDGRERKPVRVNSVVRGVVVPAGRHGVSWTYRLPGLRLSLAIFALGLLAAAGWLYVQLRASGGPGADRGAVASDGESAARS